MAKKYDFQKIEKKWQQVWQKEGTYEPFFAKSTKGKPDSQRKKFYNLMMFPYPSAEGLHVGNMYAFTGSDVYGRFKRMQGHDVFEPMGLDGFGIHSENYALKIGAHPMEQAKVSEKRFYKQLEAIGNGFAWNERLETYDPDYYKWTQWIFIQMFKRGLAYRKKQPVNWCPSCKTVLADEQVIAGKCERCGTVVIKKDLEQWFFRITNYAERLLKNLGEDIDPVRSRARGEAASPEETAGAVTSNGIDWSEKVKIAQRNWIGKSEGAEIDFEIKTKERPNFVLLHGYGGSPNDDFFPWLKKELEKRGYKVQAPLLPHNDKSRTDEKEDVESVLKNVKFDQNTMLLGHSLGAPLALKVLERLKKPIRKLVLVAGFLDPRFRDTARPFERTWNWTYDFSAIKKNVPEIVALHDINDPIIPPDQGEKLRDMLGARLIKLAAAAAHFNSTQEPSVLRYLLDEITVFTTRPDTLFGATFLVIAPELAQKWLEVGWKAPDAVKKYVKKSLTNRSQDPEDAEKEKTGVFSGVYAVNPANKEKISVWVADYVLMGYGTGAIMAVPAHDERDFEFAKKYKLPIRQVIKPIFGIENKRKTAVSRDTVSAVVLNKQGKVLFLRWPQYKWLTNVIGGIEKGETPARAAEREVFEETGYKAKAVFTSPIAIESHFFAEHKNEWRSRMDYPVLLKLEYDRPAKIAAEELAKHSVVWMDRTEALRSEMFANNKLALDFALRQFGSYADQHYGEISTVINSEQFDGMDSETAKWEITKFVGGEKKIQYRLRDWLISRQRYWGPPIPMVFCEACAKAGKGEQSEMPGWHAAPEKDLPVKLPFVKDFRPKGKGESPLATVKSFYETKCPKCGSKARRETDVSDTFLDSAWYYLRYPSLNAKNSSLEIRNSKLEIPWNQEITRRWLPVDTYIGGAEHSVLHLLYSRFLAMAFHDFGLLNFEEPFTKFRAHGLLIKEGGKMSKSKGNVVNPDEYIKKFGADTLRMYLMFIAPFEQGGDFRDSSILGISRFLERAWRFGSGENSKSNADSGVKKALHKTIKKVTDDIENLRYNTAISALMILLNEFEAEPGKVSKGDKIMFLKLLAPFAPHIAEELWHAFGNKKSIHLAPWPEYDSKLISDATFTLVIQVNGKIRDSVEAPAGTGKENAEALALDREKIKAMLGSKKPQKIIYVPGRLVNIVI